MIATFGADKEIRGIAGGVIRFIDDQKSIETIVFDSMLPVILLSIPKLIIGQRILRHYRPGGMGRMFTPLWWTRHFIYVSAVFIAGRLLGG